MQEYSKPVSWPTDRPPIVLVGPTATGKTDAAIMLAERIDGEIINADSVQVYRGMDIGSAKPSDEEQSRATFHILDILKPDVPFTVADWKQRAESAIDEIVSRGKYPIICGGTGLYIRALLDDWTMAETPRDESIRAELNQEATQLGAPLLHARLAEVDPETAARLHPNDAVRIVRALEVHAVTGKPISEYQAQDRSRRRPRPAYRFALSAPRPVLYARIEARVDRMIDQGLEQETRALLEQGYSPSLGPLKSLGYKEMIAYLQGAMTMVETIEAIKHNTRRFAKRQLIWFRADPLLQWFDVESLPSATVATCLLKLLAQENPTAISSITPIF